MLSILLKNLHHCIYENTEKKEKRKKNATPIFPRAKLDVTPIDGQNQRHIFRERRPDTTACPGCGLMGTHKVKKCAGRKRYFVLCWLEQPRQVENLLYRHGEPNEPTMEGPLCFVLHKSPSASVSTTEYISLQEMKQGQCICPLSWSVHCNFTGDGKCNKRGWACTPPPSPARTNSTHECTPESRRYYSVYSVVSTVSRSHPSLISLGRT